jgi:hypothetical protein
MGFLVFISCLILGIYLLRWLFRQWLGRRMREIQRQMENSGTQGYYRTTSREKRERKPREGEIKVETGTAPGKKVNDRIGDYVEYEEVEITEETTKETR